MDHESAMLKKQKNILFVMRESRQEFFESVLKHGHERNWSIEFHEGRIPLRWFGDGAIIDFISKRDLTILPKGLPVASRFSAVLPNVYSVHGNVAHDTKMAFEFLRMRGYRNYAAVNMHPLIFDPVKHFGHYVKSSGFQFYHLYWNMVNNRIVLRDDFTRIVNILADFLRSLPRPCALFIGSIRRVHLVYRVCRQEGIRVPDDIAIIANTDDPQFGVHLCPSVTVVTGHLQDIGKKVVEGLDGMLRGQPSPKSVQFVNATQIIARQSTDVYAVEHPAVMRAINHILQHYGDIQLDLNKITEVAECSAMTLQRNFVKHVNRLPSEFLRDIRLESTAKLLQKTSLPVRQIAERVGYGSNMSLGLAFKKKFGATPGQYRKQHRA